jgi:hypothetical protein
LKEANKQAFLPITTVNLAGGKPLIGLPSTTVMGSPMLCSPDGNMFVEVFANPKNPVYRFPDLYKVSTSGEVKQLNLPVPTEYQQLFLDSVFPGENSFVSLIQASSKKNRSSDPPKTKADFISLIDLGGDSPKLIELHLNFQPLRLAVLPSGRFIVLGFDTANLVPVLAYLNDDGTFLRSIDLDNRTYDNSKELKDTYNIKNSEGDAAKRKQIMSALSSASFVPHGSKVLFVQAGSNLPIHILGESGDEGTVSISLPSNYLIQNVLGSERTDTWVIRAQKMDSFQKMANEHFVMNPEQKLFEVNEETGKATRVLETNGVPPMMVTCAANNSLSALYNDPPPGAGSDVDRFVLAIAPR